MLVTDMIGNPAKYTADDSPTELHSDSTDSSTLLRKGALCWDLDNFKMYVYLDTDDRDNVDMTAEDFSDTAKYEYVIGRYPNSWYDRMDSGLMMPTINLVDDMGVSNLPDGSKDTFKLSSKNKNGLESIVFDGFVFTESGTASDYIGNTATETDLGSSEVAIVSYAAQPNPTTQKDNLETITKSYETIMQNSYSWTRGGGITNAVTCKVSVADVAVAFESKALENLEYDKDGVIFTEPKHDTIGLTQTNSPTSKAFTTLVVDDNKEICLGLYGEEIIYDTDDGFGDNGKFDNLTNGTFTDLNGNTARSYFGIQRTGYTLGDTND